MRVNIYAEEMTDRLEIISKNIDGRTFTGLRFYLHLPTTVQTDAQGNPVNVRGPFIHRAGDDDSSAVTFWGKRDLRVVLRQALAMLDAHYGGAIDGETGGTTEAEQSAKRPAPEGQTQAGGAPGLPAGWLNEMYLDPSQDPSGDSGALMVGTDTIRDYRRMARAALKLRATMEKMVGPVPPVNGIALSAWAAGVSSLAAATLASLETDNG